MRSLFRSRKRIQGWIRDPRFYVLLLPFVILSPIWLTGKALYWGTPSTQFIPWWVQSWTSLAAGELPLWNPMLGMGTPLLANYQSALIYPGTWVYLLLFSLGGTGLMAWGMAPMLALHLSIAIAGMFRFLEKLGLNRFAQVVGGLAFGFSGYVFSRSHFLSINASLAWLPWILALGYSVVRERKKISWIFLSGVLCLQWLAGHAQTSWYSLLLLGFFSVYWIPTSNEDRQIWKVVKHLFSAGLLAISITAIQIWPTLEFLANSQRASQVSPEFALTYSFWPWRILSLIAPNLFGNPAHGNYWGYGNFWEDAIYVGFIPAILGMSWLIRNLQIRKNFSQTIFLSTLTISSLLLALGANTPIFPWLYAKVPGIALFQAPTRISIWAVFSIATMAALGAQQWSKPKGRKLYWTRLSGAGALAVLIVALLLPYAPQNNLGLINQTIITALIPLGTTWLAAVLLTISAPDLHGGTKLKKWHWIAMFVIALELSWTAWNFMPSVSVDFYNEERVSAIAQIEMKNGNRVFLEKELEDKLRFEDFFRFDSFLSGQEPVEMRNYGLPNLSILDGVPSINNYDPIQIERYQNAMDYLSNLSFEKGIGILEMWGVSAYLTMEGNGEILPQAIAAELRFQWFECAIPVGDASEALYILKNEDVPVSNIIIEIKSRSASSNCKAGLNSEPAQIVVVEDKSLEMTIEIDASHAGWLFIADTYYPGWHAYLDQDEVTIYPANAAFRAIEIPVGKHNLELRYEPRSFWGGALISVIGISLYFYLLIKRREHETKLD